jgi:hypothetical protein
VTTWPSWQGEISNVTISLPFEIVMQQRFPTRTARNSIHAVRVVGRDV